jgi:Glutaminase
MKEIPVQFQALFDQDGNPYYTTGQAAAILQEQVKSGELCLENFSTGCVSRSEIIIDAMFRHGVKPEAIGRAMIMAPRYEKLSFSGTLRKAGEGRAEKRSRSNKVSVDWGNHIVPSLRVLNPKTGEIEQMVLDPVVHGHAPLDIPSWKKKLGCVSALVTMGGLGGLMLAAPEYLTDTQLGVLNEVFEKVELGYRVETREEFRAAMLQMNEDEKERFESRLKNKLNIIRGTAYNVWRGQELNGEEDVPGVMARKRPDWNEMVPETGEWSERLALAAMALKTISETKERSFRQPG